MESKEGMREKPAKVEVGQRWRVDFPGCGEWDREVKVIATDGTVTFTSGTWIEATKLLASPYATFLGYASTGPGVGERPKPAKGQRWRDVRGHNGRAPYNGGQPFTLVSSPGFMPGGWIDDVDQCSAWKPEHFTNGRLEFVDHGTPPPAPQPAPDGIAVELAKSRWRAERNLDENLRRVAPGVPVKPETPGICGPCTRAGRKSCRPLMGRMVGEKRAPDGTPLSALESVPSKPSPEPWRPSVDDYDLLPDQGTSYSARGPR